MDASEREKLNELFRRALALPPEDRPAFVAEACGTNAVLRDELISLLSAYESSAGYFEELADSIIEPGFAAVAAGAGEELAAGTVIGHYEIVARLGEGGMGVVYKARDLRLDRPVVLKFLPPLLAADESARARLVTEAKAVSALDHPNIAVVYEIAETEGGRPFIAMAWYEGETLKQKLARGPLPVREAVDIAVQLAGALAAAHGAGIIHRDIKPANVLITGQGVGKLVDFGIAKVVGTNLTQPGTTLGTVAYMSPEQTRGQPVDQRTDLWSLGILLHEMLTGQRPFRAADEATLIYAVCHREPAPVAELEPDVPPELGRVVRACLEKDPLRRYARAEDLVRDLNAIVAGRQGAQGPVGHSKPAGPETGRFAAVLALVAAAIVVAAVVLLPRLPGAGVALAIVLTLVLLGFSLALLLARHRRRRRGA